MEKDKESIDRQQKRCQCCKYCYKHSCCNAESDKVGKTVWPWTKACKYWTENE